ncbi:MAG: DUF4190 domain-containing protein [Patescibacteria group bacterium]
MNKFSIVAIILSVISFLDGLLVQFISGLAYAPYTLYLLPLLGLIFGISALRQIARTREKGKVVAWIAVILSGLKIAGIVLLLLLGAALMNA